MIIKFTRRDALNLFKWRTRRKIKKHEKLKEKNPEYKKKVDKFVNDIDHLLAFGISYNEDSEGNLDIDHVALLPKEDGYD